MAGMAWLFWHKLNGERVVLCASWSDTLGASQLEELATPDEGVPYAYRPALGWMEKKEARLLRTIPKAG